jgi:hypothetical protein
VIRDSFLTPARQYARGIGDAVADRTYNRKKSDGTTETWEDVANRVSVGNQSLTLGMPQHDEAEFHNLHHHMRQGSVLLSGRHLQHGDANQASRNLEVFCNCSTSAATFLTFYLLLNGSGVGRAYDDDMMAVDFGFMPIVVPVIDMNHADVQSGEINTIDQNSAAHLYKGAKQHVFRVPDSREGWAKALEKIETMTFDRGMRRHVLIIDFSDVRPRGAPIGGMQSRPASGPGPLMQAISNLARLRDAKMQPWRSAMYADHYVSECVLVGGARRAARMSTKTWRDKSVLEFIALKKGGFLWSSNNSVTVDEEFWKLVRATEADLGTESLKTQELAKHAKAVFEAICAHSYKDGTGEPGFINQDKLTSNPDGLDRYLHGDFVESERYKLDDEAKELMGFIARRFNKKRHKMIVNPCGEIALTMLGGYCVIGDVVPFHAGRNNAGYVVRSRERLDSWDADAEDAFRVTTRALIRVNMMDCLYKKEVERTNRIGVGMTGIHEYAWARFGYTFRDLIDEAKSKDFWLTLSRFKRAVQSEAISYSAKLGMVSPHTDTTVKPSGTISKLFALTEGAHLPSMREYVRWVQFRNDDPLIDTYRDRGYPIRKLQTYGGTTIVGFPTRPTICDLGMGDRLVTAAEATPAEQYQWIRLLEKYWIRGVAEDGVTPLEETGNQVSYTLKYNPKTVTYNDFMVAMLQGQSTVRCCSVMPQSDTSAYEYLPEQPVSKHEFELIAQAIQHTDDQVKEDAGFEHIDCASGACPIDWKEKTI